VRKNKIYETNPFLVVTSSRDKSLVILKRTHLDAVGNELLLVWSYVLPPKIDAFTPFQQYGRIGALSAEETGVKVRVRR